MKKLIIVLFLITLFIPVYAQNNSGDTMYYVSFPVERIYPTSQGYIVQYRTGFNIRTIGIPNDWFTRSAGKAEMVNLQTPSDWPLMTIFYSNGEFAYVRLYVHRLKSHITWGSIPQGTDLSRYFGDGETFNVQF